VYSGDGVVIFADLGSAVLSAETALELLDGARRARVRLSTAPLVEGAAAAASLAAAGASLEEILRPPGAARDLERAHEKIVTVPNRLGLHARPAALLVRLARRLGAAVTLENLTRGTAPADASGIQGVLALGARHGHQLRVRGPREAVGEVAAFIEAGCGGQDGQAESARETLAGRPASAGIAIGPLVKLRPAAASVPATAADGPEAEERKLQSALRSVRAETRALCESTRAGEAGIFDAQLLFLEDQALIGGALRRIREEAAGAAFAWQSAAAESIASLEALDDPYLRARAADVADVSARVLGALTGSQIEAPALARPSILAARDVTPSEVKQFDPALVLGLCLEAGSATAHSVILARAMGIPAVAGLGPGIMAVDDGTIVALDGERGRTWVSPGADVLRELEERRGFWLDARRAAREARDKPAVTRDGRRLRVVANIGSVAGAAEAVESGAEGVGVLRTEFLFLNRDSAPSEDEQLAAYSAIAAVLGQRPLVIRTLDAGGDKPLPYLNLGGEPNPFLGWRGIRVTLDRRDLLTTQLRAILRAGPSVEALLPMISSLGELREVKAVLEEVETGSRPGIRIGVMIEVPAAVAVADQLAREADFFSIGTNDLAQYVMAADRTNARVAALADALHPAVLRMIRQAVEAARAAGIPVTLCGELAADPLATPLLIGLGLEEFSVSPPFVAGLKQAIARCARSESEALAREALTLESAEAVRRLLRSRPPPPENA
jgi:phosphocarrier protein FPr